ncbi:unnamed protein product [Ambrosiozyma monospora]|uniref:Unnamed protein product n=1 Tax=Ambrosiozyma monospora TaxID=43982 RepID=A0ACB5T975_AMBMO|nr:unnamed protein product [Ambrosiozyma monospora]
MDDNYDDEEDKTSPLNLGASKKNVLVPPAINVEESDTFSESIDETAQSRPHARSRAFSRIDTETKKQKDFYELFEEIGFDPATDDAASLEKKILRELERIQFQKINSLTEMTETMKGLTSSVSKALDDCNKIDPLISLYGVQLSGFKDDVEYIEKQGHGLQVETTNKKLLIQELNDILHSVDIPDSQLNVLLSSKVEAGLHNSEIESVLSELYVAIAKMRGTGDDDDQMGRMRALQEKKRKYEQTSKTFISNFKEQARRIFAVTCTSLNSKLGLLKSDGDTSKFIEETVLGKFSSLISLCGIIAYAKQVSEADYDEIIEIYQQSFTPFFDNYASVLLSKFDSQTFNLDLSSFSFDSPPKILIDKTSAKLGSSTKSKRPTSNSHYDRLEELGLGSFNASAKTVAAKVLSSEEQMGVLLSSLIDDFFTLITLHQEFIIKLFSISSSPSAEFESIIKESIQTRISNFKERKAGTLFEAETDRDLSDKLFDVIDVIHSNSTKSITDKITTTVNRYVLQTPSLLI